MEEYEVFIGLCLVVNVFDSIFFFSFRFVIKIIVISVCDFLCEKQNLTYFFTCCKIFFIIIIIFCKLKYEIPILFIAQNR